MMQPLAACLLPLMVIALASLLQGYDALPFLYIGFPAAILVASGWTHVRISDEIVELHFRDSDLALRSLLSAASPKKKLSWFRILDIKRDKDVIRITLGHEFYRILLSEWPEQEHLVGHLESAESEHAAGTVS